MPALGLLNSCVDITWSTGTAASVSGSGNFLAQCGGTTWWVTDTSNNGYTAANLAAGANAAKFSGRCGRGKRRSHTAGPSPSLLAAHHRNEHVGD